MLVLPASFMTVASYIATTDLGAARKIAATSADISKHGVLSVTTSSDTDFIQFTPMLSSSSALSLFDKSTSATGLFGRINNLDDAMAQVSETASSIFEILASTKSSDFEPIFDNPFAVLSTLALVTASDMVPFVPCQPLAISLGAKYGAWAFPVCVVGQTMAGVLAFLSSRKVSDAKEVQKVLESLGEGGQVRFQKFKTESLLGNGDNNEDNDAEKERTVFFALVGLRLAPFFPFSAGNYLLGGATDVGLRPFVLATILGCMFSNAISVLLGMGGAELFMNSTSS